MMLKNSKEKPKTIQDIAAAEAHICVLAKATLANAPEVRAEPALKPNLLA